MKDGGAIKTKAYEERLAGGRADGRPDSDFDASRLEEGEKVEREHTDDPAEAREIAKDHLTEDPDYYQKLKEVEKGESRLELAVGILVHLFGAEKVLRWLEDAEKEVEGQASEKSTTVTKMMLTMDGRKVPQLVKAGFTGEMTDKLGRRYYFVDGRRVAREQYEAASGKKAGEEAPVQQVTGGPPAKRDAHEETRQKIRDILKGEKTPDAMAALLENLSKLSTGQLHDIRKELTSNRAREARRSTPAGLLRSSGRCSRVRRRVRTSRTRRTKRLSPIQSRNQTPRRRRRKSLSLRRRRKAGLSGRSSGRG
jgi:hypothetical protein